jgi:hypothetical protein
MNMKIAAATGVLGMLGVGGFIGGYRHSEDATTAEARERLFSTAVYRPVSGVPVLADCYEAEVPQDNRSGPMWHDYRKSVRKENESRGNHLDRNFIPIRGTKIYLPDLNGNGKPCE